MTDKKPALGIMPKSMHDYMRAKELSQAIARSFDNDEWPTHSNWVAELCELCEEYTNG